MIDKLITFVIKQSLITAVILYLIYGYLPLPEVKLQIGCGTGDYHSARYDNRRVTVEPLGGL